MDESRRRERKECRRKRARDDAVKPAWFPRDTFVYMLLVAHVLTHTDNTAWSASPLKSTVSTVFKNISNFILLFMKASARCLQWTLSITVLRFVLGCRCLTRWAGYQRPPLRVRRYTHWMTLISKTPLRFTWVHSDKELTVATPSTQTTFFLCLCPEFRQKMGHKCSVSPLQQHGTISELKMLDVLF